MRRIGSLIILTLLLTGILPLTFKIILVRAGTIVVPDDYPTIQEAVDAASSRDTVSVKCGIYREHVVVNKPLSLLGEDTNNTVIDGNGTGCGILVTADYTSVKGLRVQNCEDGIKVESDDNVISSNLVSSNGHKETEVWTNQEIYQDFVSPVNRWYVHNLINGSYTAFFNITEHTPAISIQALGREDVNQLFVGLFYDRNSDNEPQLKEYVSYGDAKERNVHVYLVNPPDGHYIIKVLGWEVLGNPGHFDLEMTRYFGYGIAILSSRNNMIADNVVSHNPVGLYLYDSSNATIQYNEAIENVGGIVLSNSSWCVISNNNACLNKLGSGIRQFGNGMTFWAVQSSQIAENNVSSNLFGIWLLDSSNNDVTGNNLVSDQGWGLVMYASHDNEVAYNNISISGPSSDGVRMMFSRQNYFRENCFESNGHAGIYFWLHNENNSIIRNKFHSNGAHGVELKLLCDNNIIADNDIRFSGINGILILESSGCTVTRNYVFSNNRGVISHDASENKIYHNNVLDSWELQAADFNSANAWDNGCEGNFWSNYNGTDLDGDGVGDTHLLWEGVDKYPLVNLYWNPADVDHDMDVDLYDAVRLLVAYGSELGNENFNPHCDISEPYGKIDLYDAVLMLVNYGEKYSPQILS